MGVTTLDKQEFLADGGEMGALIRSINWADTPLGAPAEWPQSLRTAVSIMLQTHCPMYIAWGASYIQLYNDAYRPLLGPAKHPQAMGAGARETLAEIWHSVGPVFNNVMQGHAQKLHNLALRFDRHEHSALSFFSFSYTPIRDETGGVGGILVTATEMPDRLIGDRQKFYSLLLQAPVAICIVRGPHYIIQLANEPWLKIVGKEAAGITGKPLLQVLPGLKGQDYEQSIGKVLHTGQPIIKNGMPVQLTQQDKTVTAYFDFIYQPLHDPDGTASGVMMAGQEVTTRVMTRKKIEESEAYFRKLADTVPVMVWMTRADGYCHYVNRQWYEFTGQTPETALGHGWLSVVHPDDIKKMEADFDEANKKQVPFYLEYRMRAADGTYQWILDSGSPMFNEQGVFEGYIGSVIQIDKRKMAENAARESEMRFRQLADSMPQIVWTANPDGYTDYYNKQWYYLIGTENEYGDNSFIEHLHPDDRARCLRTWYRCVQTGEPYEIEYRFKIKQPVPEYRWFLARALPIRDSEGQIIKWYGTSTDIDHVKRIEQSLRESEQELEKRVAERTNEISRKNSELEKQNFFVEAILDASVDLIAVVDTSIRYVSVNKKYLEVYKLKKEEVLGKKITDVLPQAKDSPVLYGIQKACTGENVHHVTYKYADIGRDYETFFIPMKNADGEIYSVVMIAHDNTPIVQSTEELKQINRKLELRNEELRQSEERYLRMTNEVEDYAIVLLSLDGYIENWNKGAEKIKGYTSEEIIGKHFGIFYTAQDQQRGLPEQLIAEAARNGKSHYEGWRVRKDGSTFWAYAVITALHDDKNDVVGFSKVTRDLTERKMAEDQMKMYAEQLEQKNRELERSNSELTSFSYVASHDLQEPLRKIQAFGNLIQSRDGNNMSDLGKDYFNRMVKAAVRMQNLIDSLLEFSRTTTARKNFEETDLNKLLDEVKKELADRIEEKKAVITSAHLPTLTVIPFQFRQLLSNLLSNSLKYSRTGATPAIDIKALYIKARDMKEKAALSRKDYYQFSITDNGIGFEQEYEEKIFELFQRLHGRNEYSGSGIGLAICKKIVENHHGFMRAEGKPGVGATFYFYIPAK